MASMATSGARRKPQKYPEEMRERAVRMVPEVREQTDLPKRHSSARADAATVALAMRRRWVRVPPREIVD